MTSLLTPYLWLAGLYVAFGISVARGDVWSTECPPPLAKKTVAKTSSPSRKITGNWNMPSTPVGPYHHRHVCERCGHSWTHVNTPKPNRIEDHICPNCKALPPGAYYVPVKPKPVSIPCPT